jgi:hypothetical protein
VEICTVGSVRGESVGAVMVDLNGHEAGNGGYRVERRGPRAENKAVTGTAFIRFRGPQALKDSQGRPTARRALLYSERCPVIRVHSTGRCNTI